MSAHRLCVRQLYAIVPNGVIMSKETQDTCVHDYGGKCRSAVHDKGKTSIDKCKACAGYINLRTTHNRALLKRLRNERNKINLEIALILHDIDNYEKKQ